jgi:hypothetical protein
LGWGAGCYGGIDDCSVNDCECASTNSNWSSCRVSNELNATVYSIGFGPVSNCQMANKTLQNIAQCGKGKYYSSDNATILETFYNAISQEIAELSYTEQISVVVGRLNNTVLYPDSYISFDYVSDDIPYGLVLTLETDAFGNTQTTGMFNIPNDSQAIEANVVSYSGSKWTDKLYIKNESSTWKKVFSLIDFGTNYLNLGDAYLVNIPAGLITTGNNTVNITTGVSLLNSSQGSVYDKAIYTLVKQPSGYSKISMLAEGCLWNLQFETGNNVTMKIPAEYTGIDTCLYNSMAISYNNNDAIDNAIYLLLEKLDLDSDNLIDVQFSEQDLSLSSVEVEGIPFTWSSEIQARVWR